jgi:hypothetical protein
MMNDDGTTGACWNMHVMHLLLYCSLLHCQRFSATSTLLLLHVWLQALVGLLSIAEMAC